jgi:predicted negative regulator of RcsB-dependent stress response
MSAEGTKMSQGKNELKKLKQLDVFQVKALGILNKLVAEKLHIAFVVVPLLIAVFGYIGFGYWQEVSADRRSEALSAIDLIHEGEDKAVEQKRKAIQDELDALDKKVEELTIAGTASGKGANPELDQINEKRIQLGLSQGELKADHSASLDAYGKFFDKYPTKPEGIQAGLKASGILVKEKKIDEALAQLEKLAPHLTDHPFFQGQVRVFYAALLEEKEKYKEALEQVELAEQHAGESLKPSVMFSRARLLIALGNQAQADEVLNKIITDYSSSQEAQKAKTLKVLGSAQG